MSESGPEWMPMTWHELAADYRNRYCEKAAEWAEKRGAGKMQEIAVYAGPAAVYWYEKPGFITGDWSVEYPPAAKQKRHAGVFPRQAMRD